MTQRRSLLIAVIVGLCWGGLCFGLTSLFHMGAADFKHALGMGRDLLAQRNPYAHEPGPYWIPYPLPAGFLALPLAALPDSLAAGVFIAISTGLLTWGILRSGETWRMAILFSWPLLYSVLFAQWSPLLCAMWFFPALAPLALCKPNIALPFVLTKFPRMRVIAVGSAVLAVSLILRPDWPWTWLQQTASYQGMTPPLLSMPLGPLVLLNLFAWQERRAWLILTMAVMPQRVFYDQLPLLLVANSNRELFWLVVSSWASFFALWMSPNMALMPGGPYFWVLAAHYLPATLVTIYGPVREFFRTESAFWLQNDLLKTRGTIDK